jgi:tetratricopeptide (TPR) repeat protein
VIPAVKQITLLLAIILCLLTIVPAHSPVSAADKWVSVRSKNFLLVGNANEKEIRQVALRMEQFREAFSRLFKGVVFNTPVPTTVIVFKSDNSYRPFKPHANTAGYFQPGEDVNYITLTAEPRGQQDPFAIIFHEYTHLMVNNTLGNAPTWFNEGLAEYYSTVKISEDQKIVLGSPISNHVYLLREKKVLPLRTLFQVDHKSPYYNEREKQSVFYAQSWALVHYLILGNGGKRVNQLRQFLKLMTANVSMEEAFQQAFAVTLESMEKELKEYISHDRYPIIEALFERKLDIETEMQATPITEAQAQAYLGDLLLHSNRADAEGYLQKALALDPDLAMAHASLGMLRVREGKDAEARKSLERAVAANSQNYLIHYYYAYALSRAGNTQIVTGFAPETLARMREELKKSIELRPDYPESYSLLAFVNMVSGTNLDESIEMLQKVLTTSPGRNDLVFMLAQLHMAKGEYKMARQLAEKVTGANIEEQVRQPAQLLLKHLTAMEEERARFRESTNRREASARTQPESADENRRTEAAAKIDPSSYLRDALKKPQPGESRIQATLMEIQCDAKGITFLVRVSDRALRIRTASFEEVDMTSFNPDAGGHISCGPRNPQNNIVLVYVPSVDARAKIDGVAKSIEFVPNDFQLNP